MAAERFDALFAACRAEGRAALLPYLTAGLPAPAATVDLFTAMAEAGADGFEVGIPYSDPLMDGPVIQEAGSRALAAGTTLATGFDLAGGITAGTGKPAVVMTYVNQVLRLGAGEFARRTAAAGASGVIVADLPVDEAGPIKASFEAEGLGLVLFVAPTTGAGRLGQVAEMEPLFVYGVSRMGVTGERTGGLPDQIEEMAEAVRAATDRPLVLGVGISTPSQAAEAGAIADGVIVGTALVRRVLEAPTPADAAASLRVAVGELAAALR